MHVVLKPFRYAHDGYTIEQMEPGMQREFHPDAIESLLREGYVGPAERETKVVAPDENKAAPRPVRRKA